MIPANIIACIPVSEQPELEAQGALRSVCAVCGCAVWVHPNTLTLFDAETVGGLPPTACIPCTLERKKDVAGWMQTGREDMCHVLRGGVAVCGLGPPWRWPAKHSWVRTWKELRPGDCPGLLRGGET